MYDIVYVLISHASRIADEYRSFSRIRQVAPIGTPSSKCVPGPSKWLLGQFSRFFHSSPRVSWNKTSVYCISTLACLGYNVFTCVENDKSDETLTPQRILKLTRQVAGVGWAGVCCVVGWCCQTSRPAKGGHGQVQLHDREDDKSQAVSARNKIMELSDTVCQTPATTSL